MMLLTTGVIMSCWSFSGQLVSSWTSHMTQVDVVLTGMGPKVPPHRCCKIWYCVAVRCHGVCPAGTGGWG